MFRPTTQLYNYILSQNTIRKRDKISFAQPISNTIVYHTHRDVYRITWKFYKIPLGPINAGYLGVVDVVAHTITLSRGQETHAHSGTGVMGRNLRSCSPDRKLGTTLRRAVESKHGKRYHCEVDTLVLSKPNRSG